MFCKNKILRFNKSQIIPSFRVYLAIVCPNILKKNELDWKKEIKNAFSTEIILFLPPKIKN